MCGGGGGGIQIARVHTRMISTHFIMGLMVPSGKFVCLGSRSSLETRKGAPVEVAKTRCHYVPLLFFQAAPGQFERRLCKFLVCASAAAKL